VLPVVLALLGAGCGGTKPPPAAPRSHLISIFEAPLQLASAPGPTLDELRRLGVGYVRVLVRWSTVAPNPKAARPPRRFDAGSPGAYPAAGWAPYDAVDREAAARGMGVFFDIAGPAPQWATGSGAPRGGVPGVWKPSAARFGAFARAVATRYSGHYKPAGAGAPLPRVSFWSIWNEPNLGVNLAPEAIDDSTMDTAPAAYRALLDAGWNALQQTGHGADTILIGEIAPYGDTVGRNLPGNFGYMVPLRFVRDLYCVNASLQPLQGRAAAARDCPTTASASKGFASQHPALFGATGFAVHPYPSGAVAPNVVLALGPEFVYLATLPRLEHVLDTVTSVYGADKDFPLYNTEYGYKTNPPFPYGAPLDTAAAYLNQAEYMTWRMPRIRSWDQYLLVDPLAGGPSEFVTGLEFTNGVHKPSYDAFRIPIYLPVVDQSSGHGLEVWGCVRPVHYVSAPSPARIELQPGGRGAFQTVATVPLTDPSGYFDTTVRFPSGGIVRLAWSYPHGPTVYSRNVEITAR
jgi:hypothetical protein